MNTARRQLGPVCRHRHPLVRSRAALAAGELRVGFLGGSITAPKTGTRWPEPWLAWLGDQFPQVRLIVENAALGATGSDLGVFRAQPEIISRGCDLVFVEYAVNDHGQPSDRRGRTREGLLRQLLAAGCDVVLVYTFCPEMQADMEQGRVPDSIAEFEALAEHYRTGSVWVGLHSWEQVNRGVLTWAEWLPDGLHPEERGSLSYAESVIAFCREAWSGEVMETPRPSLPPARHPRCWDRVSVLPLEVATWSGPWTLRRWSGCLGMDRVLRTVVPGARLRIPFQGRGLVLGFDFGRLSAEIRYRVDGGDWTLTQRDRPAWAGDSGWFRPTVIADEMAGGEHVLELESVSVPVTNGFGTVVTLGLIGVIH